MPHTKLLVLCGLLTGLVLSGCTTTRWMVQDRRAEDTDTREVIERKQVLSKNAEVHPEQPYLDLAVSEIRRYRINERVKMERFIQRYRPKWGFMALSMMASGLSFYAAHTDRLIKNQSLTQSIALNAAGGVLALSAFLNMKPIGEPQPTGETQLQRKTGEVVRVDTVRVPPSSADRARARVYYGDSLVVDDLRPTVQLDELRFNFISQFDTERLSGLETDSIFVEVEFNGERYDYALAMSDMLIPYAEVESDVSELRSEPRLDEEMVLMDLARGSRLEIEQQVDGQWYRVLYGLSPAYISTDDAHVVWRRSDSEMAGNIVEVPNVPFGQIDVESNVPVLTSSNRHAVGLTIANENYRDRLESWTYGLRDQKLIKHYLNTALGFAKSSLYEVQNFSQSGEVQFTIGQVAGAIVPDSTDLFVYLTGRGEIRRKNGSLAWYMAPVINNDEPRPSWVNIEDMLQRLAELPAREIIVWIDIEFEGWSEMDIGSGRLTDAQAELSRALTGEKGQSVVIFSSRPGQEHGLYADGNRIDNRHHIMPYYFAGALQQRNTRLGELRSYLERNVTYTSRKLYDRPQEPRFFGNMTLDLRGGY